MCYRGEMKWLCHQGCLEGHFQPQMMLRMTIITIPCISPSGPSHTHSPSSQENVLWRLTNESLFSKNDFTQSHAPSTKAACMPQADTRVQRPSPLSSFRTAWKYDLSTIASCGLCWNFASVHHLSLSHFPSSTPLQIFQLRALTHKAPAGNPFFISCFYGTKRSPQQ